MPLYPPTHYTEPRIYRYPCIQYITRNLEYTLYRYPCILQHITRNLEYTDIFVSST